MPTILAIETSADLASAALLHGDVLISDESGGVVTHSQTILPMVQRLLAQAGISLAQCDAIAYGAGPGSFTGVRTACGIAQGLAFGAELPVLPVVTLLAMAQDCRERSGENRILAVLDARMGEVYWAQYEFADGWQTMVPPTLSSAEAVAPIGDVLACGNGLRAYADAFDRHGFRRCGLDEQVPHAVHIARLGESAWSRGAAIPAREAEPLYLRNKVALTTSERMAKAAKEAA
ncbi:MAG TPA: tRNA (adenosine(37)-N6)-threonylcarbamoyltransferase complex dimerization subunit type 1 TsaB [Oxalicibacterium sp.]|nr:tRNA (adenosine(37)-N6)-threonylcarbamoyltransferase complex dimerization subunit type 1 TsaB [Oxalicibacterium sp.]